MTLELLTHTKRRDFQNCPRYYLHRHLEHLERRAKRPGRRRGTIFGDAIYDACVAHKVDPEVDIDLVVAQSVSNAYAEIVETGNVDAEQHRELEIEEAKVYVMVNAYLERYGYDVRREIEFNLPLVNPRTGRSSRAFRRGGKIDGIVIIGPQKVSIIEDKFVGSIQKAMIERLPLDSQASEYVDAFLSKGWDASVRYRHTKFPGKNPLPPKQFKTKDDYPGETLDEFVERLREDVVENPGMYFDEQILYFPKDHLDDYRQGRWGVSQAIIAGRKIFRKHQGDEFWSPLNHPDVVEAFPMNPSRCWEYGGCEFIPLCTKQEGAIDLYQVVEDNQELSKDEDDTGKAVSEYAETA